MCRIEVCQNIVRTVSECWMRVSFRVRFQKAKVRLWWIAVACGRIQTLAPGSDSGRHCVRGGWARLAKLGRLIYRLFLVSIRLPTYVSCPSCSGSTVKSQQKRKVLTGCLCAALMRHKISYTNCALRRIGVVILTLNVGNV